MEAQERIETLRKLATEVLEDEAAADRWLRSEIVALGMKRPIDVATTDEGYETCRVILHRIEFGIYS